MNNPTQLFSSLIQITKVTSLIVTLLLANIACANEQIPTKNIELRVAVAANFQAALNKLEQDFSAQTAIKITVISGASGTLYQQIKYGAPFDIFLSADTTRPNLLVQEGFAAEENFHIYAIGQLALFAKNNGALTLNNLTNLANNKTARLAIANPQIAPYGKAAEEVLTKLNLWQTLQGKLVTGININQTFQQTYTGAVDMGIVAYSQLLENNLTGLLVPTELYSPIKQGLVILKRSQKQKAAEQFVAFLLNTNNQHNLQDFGYLPAVKIIN